MGVRVEVVEGEPIQSALWKLRRLMDLKYRRSFCKSFIGHYVKPSVRRRRKEMLRKRNTRLMQVFGVSGVRLNVGLRGLHNRKDGFR